MKKSIIFIIPYFGPFPFWMNYFLASCEKNSDVDFAIYSDNPKPDNLPKNVQYEELSFKQYCDKISEKLGIHFEPDNPYKLCDVKPAYGLIHQDEFSNYDFWGFCDIDLVFGNIRHFVTDEILDKYDFFSAYDRRVSGHFFLTRNTSECSQTFMKVANWKNVFENKENFLWDEKDFSTLFVKFKNHPSFSRKLLSWLVLPLSRKAYFEEQYSTPGLRYDWVDGSRNFPTEWYWKSGKLTNNASDREFLYFHFLKWKRDWASQSLQVSDDENLVEWKITSNGFSKL